jgi:hypothetical protein
MGQYRIVDLYEFYGSRVRAMEVRAKDDKIVVHEGELFKRAALYASFPAKSDWRAMDAFRRFWGWRNFDHGRFMALPKGLWEKLCAIPSLPRDCTHNNLRAAVAAARPLKPAVKPRRREPAVDPKRPAQLLLFV